MVEFKKIVFEDWKQEGYELSDEEIGWLDDPMIRRYLSARDYDLKKCTSLLRTTLDWRRDFKPQHLNLDNVPSDYWESGRMYLMGIGVGDRPIVMSKVRGVKKQVSKINFEDELKYLMFIIELAISQMDKHVEDWIWFIDLSGFSRNESPPLGVMKSTIQVLNDHYPSRLFRCFILDAPWVFSILWKMISPFIDPISYAKFNFLDSDKKKRRKVLSEFVDPAILETSYGGDKEPPTTFDAKFFENQRQLLKNHKEAKTQ